MVNNSFLTVGLGDFNAKYNNEIITYGDSKFDGESSQFGLEQIIKEHTHIIGDFSLCIDLIFTNQPNLVLASGVHFSLHANYHDHITFAKFNLKMHLSPPYEREIRHYQKANVEQIRQAISQFPWDVRVANININKQV